MSKPNISNNRREQARSARLGLGIGFIWMVPTVVLSLIIGNWIPTAVGAVAGFVHALIYGLRSEKAKRERRVAFWSGKPD